MRFLLLALSLTAAGCPTTAHHGFAAWGQEKHALNTAQTCIDGEKAVRLADRALPNILAALTRAGYLDQPWAEVVKQNRRFLGEPIVGVCLVPEPEACCIGGACAGPHKESGGAVLHARKAGCASDGHAWASLSWPPLCESGWPDEPHCVSEKSLVKDGGWEQRLFHELFNVAIIRWVRFQCQGPACYSNPIYKVEETVRMQLGL